MYDTAIIDLLWTGRAVMPAAVLLDDAAPLIGCSQPSFWQSCVALSVNQQVKPSGMPVRLKGTFQAGTGRLAAKLGHC